MSMLHKTSIIHPNANIHESVEVGAFCIIEDDVKIEAGNIIHPYVHIMPGVQVGKNNIFHQGSIIGGDPQDLKYKGEDTKLIIGDNNTIREYCTLNRGTDYSNKTVIFIFWFLKSSPPSSFISKTLITLMLQF